MAKRVLQVTPSYPPVVGGIEDHVANLVDRLPEYGYEPVVLTPDREGVGNEEGVYRESPILSVSKAVIAPGIAARHFTLDYDLIHVHAPYHFGQEFSALARLIRNVPLAVTVHMYGTRDSLLPRFYDRTIYNRCLDVADVVVPTTQDYVAEFDWFQRHSTKCHEVPLGVDVDHYSPVENARERLGYRPDEDILLFVGSMEPLHEYKNVDLLIKTFARESVVDRLVLVGSGENRAEYQQLAHDEGVGDQVDFPGYVPEADLPMYYSTADAFVLPSTFDSFGIALVEAMACGTPVVATDLPGVREVVGTGGVTFSSVTPDGLATAIETVLRGEFDTRNRVLGRYSHTAVVDSIVEIYDELSGAS